MSGFSTREDFERSNQNGAARAARDDWRSRIFTASALQTMTFAEVSYVVPGLIPEGLTILAGRPKIGKSWLALALALGVPRGEPVLGNIIVELGDVLYCCLEDNKRRLKRRISKLLSIFNDRWPERLTLATSWRRLDEGGVKDIEEWCNSVERPRLVILDTLAGVRPARGGNDTLYEGDYKALRDLHRIANERGIAIVVLHHTRKMEAEDPVDTISGSLGLAGAADTCLILSRGSSGTTLYVRGRDVEECEKAIIFGSANCQWTLLGDAAEVHQSDTRKAILDALRAATALMSPQDIANVTSLNRNVVDQRLLNLRDDGKVVQVSRGLYAHPDKEFSTPRNESASARKNHKK
jgi:RecA-family ATPase